MKVYNIGHKKLNIILIDRRCRFNKHEDHELHSQPEVLCGQPLLENMKIGGIFQLLTPLKNLKIFQLTQVNPTSNYMTNSALSHVQLEKNLAK